MSLSVSDPHGLSRRPECVGRSFLASPPGPRAAAASRLPKGSGLARSNPRPANKPDSLTSSAQHWIFNLGNSSHYLILTTHWGYDSHQDPLPPILLIASAQPRPPGDPRRCRGVSHIKRIRVPQRGYGRSDHLRSAQAQRHQDDRDLRGCVESKRQGVRSLADTL